MDQLIFLILSSLAIISALCVVLVPNPVYSVLFLVMTFFTIAGHYAFILGAQFLAIVNVIVYAGAIMVLFLFVIMLLNLNKRDEFRNSVWVKALGIFCGGLFVLALLTAISGSNVTNFRPTHSTAEAIGTVQTLGKVLFTDFILPFEICSVLFLSAMIGAVMLGKKNLRDH